jgi:hypothetical protein
MMTAVTLISPATAHGQTSVRPSIAVSERYDSNVFFGVVGPGVSKEDWVSNITPQLTLAHKGREVDWSVNGGITSELYVNNPGLNYVGVNGGGSVEFDRWLQKYVSGAKLRITEGVLYTPQMPNFLAPVDPDGPPSAQGEVVRGIQLARANSVTTTTTVTGSAPLTSHTTWNASYSYSALRFGRQYAALGSGSAGSSFFNTSYHSVTTSVTEAITARDLVGVGYQYTYSQFSGGDVGAGADYGLHNGFATYTRLMTPYLTTFASAGLLVLPAQFEGGATTLNYTLSGGFMYRVEGTNYSLTYSRGIYPAIGVGAVPSVSQTIIASASRPFTASLSGSLSLNYGFAESKPSGVFDYTAKGATAALNYIIETNAARTITASASYSYQDYEQTFGGVGFQFDRSMAMLSIRGAWN